MLLLPSLMDGDFPVEALKISVTLTSVEVLLVFRFDANLYAGFCFSVGGGASSPRTALSRARFLRCSHKKIIPIKMMARLTAEMTIPACAPGVIVSQRRAAGAEVVVAWDALVRELARVEVGIETV
jgi:hypothetical protein